MNKKNKSEKKNKKMEAANELCNNKAKKESNCCK